MNGRNLFPLSLALIAAVGCGSVAAGDDPPDVVDHGADGSPSAAARVVDVDPPAGSLVDEELAVAITFSEPMDREAVEAALGFPGAAAPTFAWNQDGTQVTASRLVAYPEGSDPDQVAPRSFQVVLAAGVAGEDELVLDYTLRYRRITTAFPWSQTLTGNCDPVCSGNWTWFAAGERSADPTVSTRGFLTIPFDLPDEIQIERAELATEIQQVIDNPFDFGDLMIDHVLFDAITGAEYNQRGTGLGALFAEADDPAAGDATVHDVTDVFIADYEHRIERSSRTQYRIRFPHDLAEDPSYTLYHSDGSWDIVQMLPAATAVTVTYLIE